MKRTTFFLPVAALSMCGASAFASRAWATPELPVSYGARPLGMGGTAVAHIDDAAAIAVNPAALDTIDGVAATVAFSPFLPRNTVPFWSAPGQPSAQTVGERSFVPLFFAGGAVRLFDRWVTGLAVYVASGAGGEYGPVAQLGDQSIKLAVGVIEAALPVSYRVTDELSVGVALRFAYGFVETDVPVDIGAGGPLRLDQHLSGTGFPGFLVGAHYRPTPELRFGAAYRSKMSLDLSGNGRVTHDLLGMQDIEVTSSWSTPHAFRLGAAYDPMEKLTLALDVTYALLDDSADTLPLSINFVDLTDSRVEQGIVLEWRDSVAGFAGVEFRFVPELAGRAGYALALSGTPDEYANPLAPPPGLLHSVHLGAGTRFGPVHADVAGAYGFGGADIDEPPRTGAPGQDQGPPGRYEGDFWLFGVSFSYVPRGE